MKFQDLGMYGLISLCAYARISGCLEGCGTIKQSCEVFIPWDNSLLLFLLFTVTSRTLLKTNTTQYSIYTAVLLQNGLQCCQTGRQRLCPRQYFHTWKMPAVAHLNLLLLRLKLHTLMLVMTQNHSITHWTLSLLFSFTNLYYWSHKK